ncbi:MAG: penicillin-binding protein 2 [Paludibacteraceae bacterium]|nr:penicillin-binding protein 2 [Paludibacteraceae bacterium]
MGHFSQIHRKDYSNRQYIFMVIVICVAVLYIIHLFNLQVVDQSYKDRADSNAFLKQVIYPSRGLIYDRNGKLVVSNQPVYDIMIVMREMKGFDTIQFCKILDMTEDDFDSRIADLKDRRKNPGYSSYTPQVFISNLSTKDYAHIQEKLFRFPGVFIQQRVMREYQVEHAALALGYIGEVSQAQIDNDSYYRRGDYKGQSGIEKMYENLLRGEKGYEILLRDVHGNIKGHYLNGELDLPPVSGRDLTLSLDIDLQAYGEALMNGKMGSIVAIEPSTGEILTLVSAPTYNPSLLVGRERSKNYSALLNDSHKPLFDRPMMAMYPPGSTFKTVQALVMQQEGIINGNTSYPCSKGYAYGGKHKLGCHSHASPLNLPQSIANSCNAYYCWALRALLDVNAKKYGSTGDAYDAWFNDVCSFGFNSKLGVDCTNEKGGSIPSRKFYDRYYGADRWHSSTVISISIGQGEILCTPVQIANLAATIANKGWYYTPHILKGVKGGQIDEKFLTKHKTLVDSVYFGVVQQGMLGAVMQGTAHIGKIDSVQFCGKTGTAQNPHGKDHSIFMAFAPMDNPKIAIAVYVENAGFGATWAVPIASLMIEKYLKGYIPDNRKWLEDRILNGKLIED